MQSPRNSEEDVRFPGAGATGACELSNMDMSAGLISQVLCKSRIYS